ncbi:MAG: TonB-dependent receptor, partial [Pirellulales bacterium]
MPVCTAVAALVLLAWPGTGTAQPAGRPAVPGVSQTQIEPEDNGAQPDDTDEDDDEPLLPPVIVRPQPEAAADGPPAEAPVPAASPTRGPFDQPLSYPRLSEQVFEGLNSVTRGDKSLFDTPSLATIIDRAQLAERQPHDMFQALQQELGVLVQRTARGQASPFVRGLTGQQVLILVDGIRLNNSTFRSGANQYFNTIDPGQVERIEVLRGPQSALWGSDAIGGVINIVTRGADPLACDYLGGSFVEYFSTADSGSYSRMNVEGWLGRGGYFAGGSYLNVNDLDRGGDLGRQPFTGYDQYAGDIKIDRLIDDWTMLTIALAHFEQDNVPRSDRFAPFVFGPPAGTLRPTFFDPQQRDLAYIRLQGLDLASWIDGYTFTASYSRQKEGSREIRDPTRVEAGEFDVDTAGFTMLFATDLGWLGRLTYGADWYHDDVDAFRNRINPTTGSVTPITPQFPDDSFYERAGTFIQWDAPLTDRLNLLVATRYENVDLGATPLVRVDPPGPDPAFDVPTHISPSFHGWTASAGLVYEASRHLHLVGSVSEGFRAPNLDDLVATNTLVQQAGQDLPSITLGPEHALTYEVGLKLDTPRLRSQAFVFWTELDDNIVRTPVDEGLFQRANHDSSINGAEWYGEYLLTRGWSMYGNVAYTYGVNLVTDSPLSRIPPTQGVLGL